MAIPNHVESPAAARRSAEKRRVKLVLVLLAVTTAALATLLWQQLGLSLLLTPFTVMMIACAIVLSLDGDERTIHLELTALHSERQARAQTHLLPRPRAQTTATSREDAADLLAGRIRAFAAAEAKHGIHFASGHLPDGEFLRSFASGELRAGDFRHGDHLRFAWLTLERMPYDLAEESIVQGLRVFLRRISGSEAQFHATRTHGWIRVLAARDARSFSDLLQQDGKLLASDGLARYWSAEALDSPGARQRVLAPDGEALPELAERRRRRGVRNPGLS